MSEELTRDEILRGRLTLWQPREGYRFAVDPLLLLDFIDVPRLQRAADLGAGCGIIALGLAQRFADAQITAIELQPRLARLAVKNAEENGLADRVKVLELDLSNPQAARAALAGASLELVVSNPPFRPLGEGDANPDDEAAGWPGHELKLTLADLARESRRLLSPGGRAVIVYPAERLPPRCSTRSSAKGCGRCGCAASTRAPASRPPACWWRRAKARVEIWWWKGR